MAEYTIIGAGAIGAILGVSLIEAGHDVRFIEANRDHVEAVRAKGLTLSGHRDVTVTAPIFSPEEADWSLGRTLLAVKSRHTVEALRPHVDRLASDGFVVSLQNGLEEYKIAELVGDARTVGAFLTFGGHYKAPGEIVYGGPGSFKIGELNGAATDRIIALQKAFSALQPVEATDNIFGFLWSKIALGAVYFATATTNSDVTELYADQRWRDLFGKLAGEVVAVAESRDVRLEVIDGFDPRVFRPGGDATPASIDATWEGQNRYWNRHEGKRTGVWRDLAIHKRKTEVDRFVGAVLEEASQRGVATPGIARLVEIVNEIERGEREQGRDSLVAIEAAYIAS
ncbi:MAG: hypothetical protein BGP06_14705 [Rhizobiales bacterium 65-9]|nr:ketopantoate reductase family protein [Hyphomicrobiales bacterium]OJY36903.1 MAG: hypothetical protein BGP06_14705 [Rhizobiales bacterium 65-9]